MSLPAGDLASRDAVAFAILALRLLTLTLARCLWALASAERAARWAGESLRTSQLSRFGADHLQHQRNSHINSFHDGRAGDVSTPASFIWLS